MKRVGLSMISLRCLAISTAILAVSICPAQQNGKPPVASTAPPMVMTIPGFTDGSRVPEKYSCIASPAAVSPEIRWSNVPAGTLSFVLVLHDLEPHPAKGIMDNTHWVLWNIPGDAVGLPEGIPTGVTLPNGTHQLKRPRANGPSAYSYYGPCAPPGPDHHYVWELYALDTTLNLPDDATRADVIKAADGHILAASSWIGYFHR